MKKGLRRSAAILLCVIMVLCTAGCGNKPTEEKTIERIIIGTTAKIETAMRGSYDFDMLSTGTMQPTVIYQDAEGVYHPQIVSWETEDSVTWKLSVIEGMKWSDGEDVNSKDIAFAMIDEGKFDEVVDSYDSEDPKALIIKLKAANPRFLSDLAGVRAFPAHTLVLSDMSSKLLSCGPYVLDEFNVEAGSISFVPNEYYPVQPKVRNVIYRLFSSEDTMYMALNQGDIDMVWNYSAGIPANYVSVIDKSAVNVLSMNATNLPAVLEFNCAEGAFADENLRMAVSYALDYEQLKTYLGGEGAGVAKRGLVPSTTLGYCETESYGQNIPKADEYMKKAGFSKNSEGKYADANGNIAGFELLVNSSKSNLLSAAEIVKTQLDAFGFEVKLNAVDATVFNSRVSNKFSENNVTMEAAINALTAAGMNMGEGLGSIYVDGNHAVQGGCQVFDGAFSDILSEMRNAKTTEEYSSAAEKLQAFYAENCPMIPLYWDNYSFGISSKYTNVQLDANFGLNNIRNWFELELK